VCEIDVFVKKRVIYMCYILEMRYTLSCQTLETGEKNIRNEVYAIMSDSRDREKSEKRSMPKNVIRNFGVKWKFFPKKGHSKFFRENFFSVLPNSAPGIRL